MGGRSRSKRQSNIMGCASCHLISRASPLSETSHFSRVNLQIFTPHRAPPPSCAWGHIAKNLNHKNHRGRKVGTAKVPDALWRKNSGLRSEASCEKQRKNCGAKQMGVAESAGQNLGKKAIGKITFWTSAEIKHA